MARSRQSLNHFRSVLTSFILLIMLVLPANARLFGRPNNPSKSVASGTILDTDLAVMRFLEKRDDETDLLQKVQAYIHEQQMASTCRKTATDALLNSCSSHDISQAELETTKSLFGVRLAMCQIEEAILPVPHQCKNVLKISFKDQVARQASPTSPERTAWFESIDGQELASCLRALQKLGTYWTTYTVERSNSVMTCQGVRIMIEKDQIIDIHRDMINLTAQSNRAFRQSLQRNEEQRMAFENTFLEAVALMQARFSSAVEESLLGIHSVTELTNEVATSLGKNLKDVEDLSVGIPRLWEPLMDGVTEMAFLQSQMHDLGIENLRIQDRLHDKFGVLIHIVNTAEETIRNWNSWLLFTGFVCWGAIVAFVIIISGLISLAVDGLPRWIKYLLVLFGAINLCVIGLICMSFKSEVQQAFQFIYIIICLPFRSMMYVAGIVGCQLLELFSCLWKSASSLLDKAWKLPFKIFDMTIKSIDDNIRRAEYELYSHPLTAVLLFGTIMLAIAACFLLLERQKHRSASLELEREHLRQVYLVQRRMQFDSRSKTPPKEISRYQRASTSPPEQTYRETRSAMHFKPGDYLNYDYSNSKFYTSQYPQPTTTIIKQEIL